MDKAFQQIKLLLATDVMTYHIAQIIIYVQSL